jgi:serine/threonine protein kinase
MGLLCCRCPKESPEDSAESFIDQQPEPQLKVTIEDFETISLLGKGAFAKVVLVRKKSNGLNYAMKILKKREITRRNETQHIHSERQILASVDSHFIVKLKYAFQTSRKLYMVMEFMPGGELFYHITKQKRFNEETARFYMCEVILGIEYLHSKSIIYRDLKPENILLGIDGHIKLTDFGLSKDISENNYKTRTFCGTPEYQAPEILLDLEYGKAVDFWSIGCLLYELISGSPPFQVGSNRDVLKAKILNEHVIFTRIFSEAARNLIDKLLVKNVRFR